MIMQRITGLLLATLGSLLLGACGTRSLSDEKVQEFLRAADDAARSQFAPNICKLRATNFEWTQRMRYDGNAVYPNTSTPEVHMSKKLFCAQAASMAKRRQYVLERSDVSVSLASDARTAIVDSRSLEKSPYYEDGIPAGSPDIYNDVQIVASKDHSIVGIDGGEIVFLSTELNSTVRLVPKQDEPLPYL